MFLIISVILRTNGVNFLLGSLYCINKLCCCPKCSEVSVNTHGQSDTECCLIGEWSCFIISWGCLSCLD